MIIGKNLYSPKSDTKWDIEPQFNFLQVPVPFFTNPASLLIPDIINRFRVNFKKNAESRETEAEQEGEKKETSSTTNIFLPEPIL